jgi:hypothetical protein
MGYNRPNIYGMEAYGTGFTPTDATLYYLGRAYASSSTVLTAGGFIVPRSGFIRNASILSFAATTAGTDEEWTWLIRNNTTAIDYAFAALGVATAKRNWINNALNIPVSAGNELFFKTTTPTWVTNPVGITHAAQFIIETP